MSISYLKIIHNGKVQTVAVCESLPIDELTSLLKAVFGVTGTIVGLLAERGLVIPISLVSISPQSVPKTMCKILVSNDSQISSHEDVKDSAEEISDDETAEMVTREIVKFIDGLRVRKVLNESQVTVLEELLLNNSTLLFAAYSIALSANDSEYLAEICKDLSQSMLTAQGRSACEAQDEVLQVCDQLYIGDKITENQLLYLRHLVLIRDESVATIYDDYQEHQRIPKLAKDLYELANTHPYETALKYDDKEEDEEDEEDENEDEKSSENVSKNSAKAERVSSIIQTLTGVVSLMLRTKMIQNTEASVLLEMIEQENDYVFAAYNVFENDDNFEELQDTLLRCAKLEIRKRVAEIKEANWIEQQQNSEDQNDEEEDEDDENDDTGKEIPGLVVTGKSIPIHKPTQQAPSSKTQAKSSNSEDDEEEEEEDFTLENISLDSILSSLNVKNIWEKSVPEKFILSVFVASIRQQISVAQAKALCDLFHADYDLVHSAWEVFTVQNDTIDFIDTLRRVVRDLDTDEQNADKYETKGTLATSNGVANGKTIDQNAAAKQLDAEKRQEAIAAVAAAKRDLLKHSLEMMVKQGLTTAQGASGLYARYLNEDVLVEAAIDTYANDRDVSEFLDTLQILANHSAEELQALMKTASMDVQVSPRSQPANSSTTSPQSYDGVQLQLRGIVAELSRNDMITDKLAACLIDLVTKKDDRVFRAYNQYTVSKDGADLIDTLLRIGNYELLKQGSKDSADADDEDDEDNNIEADEGDEQEDEESLLKPEDQKSVVDILSRANAVTPSQTQRLNSLIDKRDPHIKKIFLSYEKDKDFFAIISNMNLSHLETAALRLAIARNDIDVRNAIEDFKHTQNEDDMIDALKRVSKKTIQATLDDTEYSSNTTHSRNYGSSASESKLGNYQDNDDDDDEEEEEDLVTTQSARDHVFPILVSELVKEGILSSSEGTIIMKHFASSPPNPLISKALDAYDKKNDMSELVEALQDAVLELESK
eukprot:gene12570-16858_t